MLHTWEHTYESYVYENLVRGANRVRVCVYTCIVMQAPQTHTFCKHAHTRVARTCTTVAGCRKTQAVCRAKHNPWCLDLRGRLSWVCVCVCVCACVCVCVCRFVVVYVSLSSPSPVRVSMYVSVLGLCRSLLMLRWWMHARVRAPLYACIRLCWVSVWSLCACIRFWWVSIRSLLRLYSILFAFAVDFLDTCFRTRQV